MGLWLDSIPPQLHALAIAAFEAGDATGFLCRADNLDGLDLVYNNIGALKDRTDGFYERALLDAFVTTRANNTRFPVAFLEMLFSVADRDRLREAGDPLPGPGPFTIYRGVEGRGSKRPVRGLSWSASEEKARWFAERARVWGLHDPAVYRVTVEARDVLAFADSDRVGRGEQEFIVLLPASVRPVRVKFHSEKGGGAR